MTDRELLRHALAVIAYRGGKTLRGAPASFANHDTGGGSTPLKILAHISDLFDWALTMCQGQTKWKGAEPGTWDEEARRFHAALATLDEYLASDAPIHAEIPRLLAGPIADSLTHVGQLAILRRMCGAPISGENYYVAEIVTGRVGAEQAPPVKAF
ncbi:MAG: hypothetical protein HZB25_02610 [Candidatus Eisenbacteria bacterium]|nr:hypothetical protein [Candidatus Eisenbacteria bacterium]